MPRRTRVPFKGTPPNVQPGQKVWCQTAGGYWIDRIARSGPRYDETPNHAGEIHLSVAVTDPKTWESEGDNAGWENWPARNVIPGDRPAPGPLWEDYVASRRGSK